jgi:hypothetical protein
MAASCGAAQSLGLEMDYRVYENWTIDKAIVHKAACRFCNDGRGIHRADEGHNGLWHGPFDECRSGFQSCRSTQSRKKARM